MEELIPVPLADRGESSAVFSPELHDYVLKEIALLNRNLPACRDSHFGEGSPLRLLGYIHSHPRGLDAAMSRPDLELHDALNENWSENGGSPCFTGIINPQRKDLCIYLDSLFSPSNVLLFAEGSDAAKWEGHRVK